MHSEKFGNSDDDTTWILACRIMQTNTPIPDIVTLKMNLDNEVILSPGISFTERGQPSCVPAKPKFHCSKRGILTSLPICSDHEGRHASIQSKADVQSESPHEFMHTNNGTLVNWPIQLMDM